MNHRSSGLKLSDAVEGCLQFKMAVIWLVKSRLPRSRPRQKRSRPQCHPFVGSSLCRACLAASASPGAVRFNRCRGRPSMPAMALPGA